MSKRKHRVPGTPQPASYTIPRCSDCGERMQRNDKRGWFCLKCADEWLKEFIQSRAGDQTAGGIHLPSGVVDPAKENPSFKDLIPNRETRRRMAAAWEKNRRT